MTDEVSYFIAQFRGSEEVFLTGCCYWFAHILTHRFPDGEIVLALAENHFMARIRDRLYDVRGNVTGLYSDTDIIPWADMPAYDGLRYGRIVRDCVLKRRT